MTKYNLKIEMNFNLLHWSTIFVMLDDMEEMEQFITFMAAHCERGLIWSFSEIPKFIWILF